MLQKKKKKKEIYLFRIELWFTQTVILGFCFYCLELVRRLSRFYRDSDSVDHSRRLFVGRIEFSRAKGIHAKENGSIPLKVHRVYGAFVYLHFKIFDTFFLFFFWSFDRYNNMVNSINLFKTWILINNLHENRSH